MSDADSQGERIVAARRQRLFELTNGRRLTPTQRRIAHSLVTNAEEAPFLTANELADRAHVSQASVTRFANALGFTTYPQLRAAMRKAMPAEDVTGRELAEMNEWQRSLTFEIGSMEELRRQLGNEGPIREAARLLAPSRPLSVLGLRSAGPVAQYFGYFASKVLPDVRALTSVGTVAMSDALQQARDAGGIALLAFLLPRYPRESIRLLEIARDLGFTIVCITDGPGSPASQYADRVLFAPVESSLVFDSHALPMTLSMVLLDAICNVDEASTQRRLEGFDRFATATDLFM